MGDPPRGRGRWAVLLTLPIVAVLAAAGNVVDAAHTAVSDRQTRTVALGPGHALAVDVTIGRVRVEGAASATDVRVEVERHAPNDALLSRLPVEVASGPGGAHVRVVQTDGGRDPDLRAELRLVVPQDAALDAVTIREGTLQVQGIHGRLRASVDRGAITAADVAGIVRLETTLGPIEVTRARLTPGGLLRLRAFNGDVSLQFSAPLEDARVMALALNGGITSTVPLTEVAGWGPRWSHASVGRADRVVSIDVVNGDIRIGAPR